MKYTIIVPLDGSEWSKSVLPTAKEVARARGGELVLVWVAPSIWIDEILTPDQLEEVQARHRQDCNDYLEKIAESLRAEGFTATHILALGDRPADQILEIADMSHAQLIAMSTHGRSGLQRMITGSTTDKIVHQSKVPVLLVRPTNNIA